jgi:hypothetical protein
MDIVDELTDDCYVLSARGVIVKALNDVLDLSFTELDEVAAHVTGCLYQYATSFCNPDQVPSIVFVYGSPGEFYALDNNEGEGEVM